MGLPVAQSGSNHRDYHNANQPDRDNAVASTTASIVSADTVPWVTYFPNETRLDTTLFSQPRAIGTMTDLGLIKASGLAPSRRNPGYLWTEEDSGNPNEIQLLRPNGTIAARFTIDGAVNAVIIPASSPLQFWN